MRFSIRTTTSASPGTAPGQRAAGAMRYRESVNHVSLAVQWALARRRGLPSFAKGPEVSAASLVEMVSAYSDPTPVGLNRNFCLRMALKIVAAGTRAMIAIRSADVSNGVRARS